MGGGGQRGMQQQGAIHNQLMKFNQSVHNQPPLVAQAVATGPSTAQPGAQPAGATPVDNLVGILTAADPQTAETDHRRTSLQTNLL